MKSNRDKFQEYIPIWQAGSRKPYSPAVGILWYVFAGFVSYLNI